MRRARILLPLILLGCPSSPPPPAETGTTSADDSAGSTSSLSGSSSPSTDTAPGSSGGPTSTTVAATDGSSGDSTDEAEGSSTAAASSTGDTSICGDWEPLDADCAAPCATELMPRVMFILDASSSMLNIDDEPGAMGTTPWDIVRRSLAVDVDSAFASNMARLQNYAHVGLVVFGDDGTEFAAYTIEFGRCAQERFAWALDPCSSCEAGCEDPWSGPPITFTGVDGVANDPPGFDEPTWSHMPLCETGMVVDGCTGAATNTHSGLELSNSVIDAYIAAPPAAIDASTPFFQVYITDGSYRAGGWSTDGAVSAALETAFSDNGVWTYVIGYGPETNVSELADMACWGSGGTGIPCAGGAASHFDPDDETGLKQVFEAISETLSFCA